MDEANGPIFDHHDELFAQIGSGDTEQQLNDFVLEMTGSVVNSSSGAVGDVWGSCPPRVADPLTYPLVGNCSENPLVNTNLGQRNFFQPSQEPVTYDAAAAANAAADNAFFENFVKTMPDDLMENFNNFEAIKRGLMAMPERHPSEQPASLMDTMHRISTDNGTQEYLDALSKPDEVKAVEQPLWNGAIDHYNFQAAINKAAPVANTLLRSMDRNGNTPILYNNGLPERHSEGRKVRGPFNNAELQNHESALQKSNQLNALEMLNRELVHNKQLYPLNTTDLMNRELTQSFLVKGLSPSVSVESGIHTPTTSYESTSPMSSGRTPLRSDDSISPLASCASPAGNVRTPDCFSPGRVRRSDASPIVRTPMRHDEAPSPRAISRTPLRAEDVPSPAMRPMRSDDVPSPAMRSSMRTDDVSSPSVRLPPSPAVPSPRAVARTPLRPDEAPSPRSVARTPIRSDDALSPRGVSRTPLRVEEVPSPKSSKTPVRVDEVPSPRTPNRTPLRCDEAYSPRGPVRTPLRSDEALSPRGVNRQYKCEETNSPRGMSRTPLRPEELPSPMSVGPVLARHDDSAHSASPVVTSHRLDVSPLPPRAPFSPGTVRRKDCETTSPVDLQAGPGPSSNILPPPSLPEAGPSKIIANEAETNLPGPSKPKKRRRTESTSSSKKKRTKNMPIYQSTVSGEESGIKLKLKLTNMPPPKKRRRRAAGDNESEKTGKRRKRIPPSPAEQSPWGRDMPDHLLERIFRVVVDEEGSVPSLVRFSSVCRLWNSVAVKAELWQKVDLSSPCIKQKCKIDRYFRWLLENRLGALRDLNLNGWKFSNLPMVLSLIGAHCSEVESIGLSGWQGLHYENLRSLLQDCPQLSRIDLSDVSPESKSTNSAVSPKSLTYLTETMGPRLTEITLAHNTLSCLPQIISSLAANCPNLQVLDLSNIRRASHAEFALHVEELQIGCPLLRILRITNSCITIASVPFDEMAASPGFPALEELSIAGHQGTESLRITSVMDDEGLERIVKTSQKLNLLDVRGCTRITESSLVRVPAWDIQHLYLSGCLITRQAGSGLELIAQKWRHSLVEIDLAWASVAEDLNAAILALAEGGADSPLRVVNLCGSAVEPIPVKTLLMRCPQLSSLNLQSCRGLPRGVKRLYERHQLPELLEMLQQNEDTRGDT